jgi:hypothetical protein
VQKNSIWKYVECFKVNTCLLLPYTARERYFVSADFLETLEAAVHYFCAVRSQHQGAVTGKGNATFPSHFDTYFLRNFPLFLEKTKEMGKWIDQYCKSKLRKYFTLYFLKFIVKVTD